MYMIYVRNAIPHLYFIYRMWQKYLFTALHYKKKIGKYDDVSYGRSDLSVHRDNSLLRMALS